MTESARRWSVGELARASGVTVRALHYYGDIGLVPSSERTPAGHRRYTEADVRRLYRVRALLQLGLCLEEIGTALTVAEGGAGDGPTLRSLLVAQLADLDARAGGIAESRQPVQGLLDQFDGVDPPEPVQLLATLESTVPIVDTQPYFSPRQRAALVGRGRELGAEAVAAYREEWLGLVERLREFQRRGMPAGVPWVRPLAARWREIGMALRGETAQDGRLGAALAKVWRDNGSVIDQAMADRVGWLEPGDLVAVMEYAGGRSGDPA